MLFGEICQTDKNYILIPAYLSERGKYIQIGFVSKGIICSNPNLLYLYHFGLIFIMRGFMQYVAELKVILDIW